MKKKIEANLLIGVLENAYFKSAEDDQEVLKTLIDNLKESKQKNKKINIKIEKKESFSIDLERCTEFEINLNEKGFYEININVKEGEEEIDTIIRCLNGLYFDMYESRKFVLNLIEKLKEAVVLPFNSQRLKDGSFLHVEEDGVYLDAFILESKDEINIANLDIIL